MNECVFCFQPSETLCQRCRTPYCSRKCQTEDWPEHKATCIPMPLLVAAKRGELSTSKNQLNESVSSVSQRLKYNGNDSPSKNQLNESVSSVSQRLKYNTNGSTSKNQLNESVSSVSQRHEHNTNDSPPKLQEPTNVSEPNLSQSTTNDSEEPEQEADELPLRPPKTKLPSEATSPSDTKVASALFNPFKRNSENIGFNVNDNKNRLSGAADIIPSANETEKTEAIPETSEPDVSLPKEILDENTLPAVESAPVAVETGKAERISRASLHNLLLKEKEKEDAEAERERENERKENIFTMKDIEIVPLADGKRIVCLDSSNIDRGYVSSCVNDGKAVAFIDQLSSEIGDYCKKTDDCYRPQIGEICLCLFDEDNEWYRAVVLDVIGPEMFDIKFIDFGNQATACTKNIRQIPRKYLHRCLVNKCYIKGFDDASPDTKFKIEAFISDNPIFEVASMDQLESGVYSIELNC